MSNGLSARPEAPWALWSGIAGAIAVAALSARGIHASASATAALGYVYLPLVAALAAVPVGLWGLALGHVVLRLRGAVHSPPMVFVAALLVAASLPAALAYEAQRGLRLEAAVREVRAMDVLALDRAYEEGPFHRDPYFLAALAQHPGARADLLTRIASQQGPEFYAPLGSLWDVMGENRQGHSVMRLVARHPNTDGEALARLAEGPNAGSIATELAANPRMPPRVLERWFDAADEAIERGLALNPKTPQRVLERLAASRDLYTRLNLAYNKATPREILDRLAADASEPVARNAAQAIERRKRGEGA